jgi:hypothetical protein
MSIISAATTAYSQLNLTTQKTVSERVAIDKITETNSTSSSTPITDNVLISSQAKAALSAAPLNNLAYFFAGRDNFPPSTTLSNEVTGYQDTSKTTDTRSFEQVALDARASMDAQYAAMKASGKPYDKNAEDGKDVFTLMANLDRRSLYAVKSNEGGKFTEDEQQFASSIMSNQLGLAMGLYSGPTSKAGKFVDPFSVNSDRFKAGVNFLDNVSPEEKKSVEWSVNRASAQIVYQDSMEQEKKVPEKLDSESPLAKLIFEAMKTKSKPNRAWTTGNLTTAEDLKQQTWFKGFEAELDKVMANNGSISISHSAMTVSVLEKRKAG